ncbi:MAG: hypothetical protein F6K24_05150 [Okeania sp. SIO2D1]|nr:hypothetical protein [Okeania sp. SIO2D1]
MGYSDAIAALNLIEGASAHVKIIQDYVKALENEKDSLKRKVTKAEEKVTQINQALGDDASEVIKKHQKEVTKLTTERDNAIKEKESAIAQRDQLQTEVKVGEYASKLKFSADAYKKFVQTGIIENPEYKDDGIYIGGKKLEEFTKETDWLHKALFSIESSESEDESSDKSSDNEQGKSTSTLPRPPKGGSNPKTTSKLGALASASKKMKVFVPGKSSEE